MYDGVVIGSATIRYSDMMFLNFVIKPEFRDQGLETEAFKMFIEEYGIKRLWVDSENEKARRIYDKCGFIIDDKPRRIEMKLSPEADTNSGI